MQLPLRALSKPPDFEQPKRQDRTSGDRSEEALETIAPLLDAVDVELDGLSAVRMFASMEALRRCRDAGAWDES